MKHPIRFNLTQWLITIMIAFVPFVSDAQTNTKKDAQDRNETKFADAGDANLLVEAFSSGMMEIKLAESIKSRTVIEDVKKISSTMIAAHTDMNNQIRQLAAAKKISLPTELTKAQADDLEAFNKKSAVDVNEEYVDLLVASHKKSVDLYEKGTKAEDADIRALFVKGLPVVKEHLSMATSLNEKMNKMDQEQRRSDSN
jgi:putative membrane protein